jgi:15-cis-phytoene synthase
MTIAPGAEPLYDACRTLHRRHGTTYYWAARLLPPGPRRHVHALYAYCRLADEIVDDLADAPLACRRAALSRFRDRTLATLRGEVSAAGGADAAATVEREVLAAFTLTVTELDIPLTAIERFLRSMQMDLDLAHYDTWADLLAYMDGSAAVIGEMMLPVLQPTDRGAAHGPARDLGLSFQLTNFLRDVGEDLERGRVYLPQDELDGFGADPWARTVTPAWRQLMRFQIARARRLYASADEGLRWLPARSAACVEAARILYSRILVEIEHNDYDVFETRARVATRRKLATVLRCLAARRPEGTPPPPRRGVAATGRPT